MSHRRAASLTGIPKTSPPTRGCSHRPETHPPDQCSRLRRRLVAAALKRCSEWRRHTSPRPRGGGRRKATYRPSPVLFTSRPPARGTASRRESEVLSRSTSRLIGPDPRLRGVEHTPREVITIVPSPTPAALTPHTSAFAQRAPAGNSGAGGDKPGAHVCGLSHLLKQRTRRLLRWRACGDSALTLTFVAFSLASPKLDSVM